MNKETNLLGQISSTAHGNKTITCAYWETTLRLDKKNATWRGHDAKSRATRDSQLRLEMETLSRATRDSQVRLEMETLSRATRDSQLRWEIKTLSCATRDSKLRLEMETLSTLLGGKTPTRKTHYFGRNDTGASARRMRNIWEIKSNKHGIQRRLWHIVTRK